MIESRTTQQFREAYAILSEEIRRQAHQAYLLFRENPRHPSLRFKKIDGANSIWSVRVSLGYRALCVMDRSVAVWYWIGTHTEYDRLI